jgi:NAD(P)-dependent dehydrogenase (short-subunit alcohol dehydrogenase family)
MSTAKDTGADTGADTGGREISTRARQLRCPITALSFASLATCVAGPILWRLWRSMRAERMRDKVVLITGGSRGLGLAIAQELANQGAHLIICARDGQELDRARHKLETATLSDPPADSPDGPVAPSPQVLAIRCDVGDPTQVAHMIDQAMTRFGRIDVLINVAGVIIVGPLATQTVEDFDEAMRTMFWGVVYPTLAVLPQMRQRHAGRIVTITSLGGKVSVPHLLSYSSAKFAATGFSEGLCAELAGTGIAVTTVVPGLMRTGSYLNAIFKGNHRAEFTWFSIADNLPLFTMSARRAARQIVSAIRERRAEVAITLPAGIGMRMYDLFPSATTSLLGIANRLLPHAGGIGPQRASGWESQTPLTMSFLTRLGQRAAETYHQFPPSPVSLRITNSAEE